MNAADAAAKITNADRLSRGLRAATWQGSKWCKPALRQAIYIRDGRKCLLCGAKESATCKLSLDHVVAHEFGGSDEASNLIAMCCRCNFRKQAKSMKAFIKVLADEGVNVKAIPARINRALARPVDMAAGAAAVTLINRAARARQAAAR